MKTFLQAKFARYFFGINSASLMICAFMITATPVVKAQSILITTISGTPVCAGSTITVSFSAVNGNGSSSKYNSSSVFNYYLSNSSGINFTLLSSNSIPASYSGSNGGLTLLSTTLTIPAATVSGSGYKISIGSSNPAYNNASPYNSNMSLAFTIKSRPTGILSGSTNICLGNPASLNIAVTGTGTISGSLSNGTGFSGTAPSITVPVNPASTAAYSISSLSSNGCTATAGDISGSATVTVYSNSADPSSATATAVNICSGQSSILSLNGGGGGMGEIIKWYSGSCGGTIAGTGNNLSVSPATTTTYYGRYENGGGCNHNSACVSVTIAVSSAPLDPTSATATATTICAGQSSTLTLNRANVVPGEIIHWYAGSCGGTAVGTGNDLAVSPTSTTTYYGRFESTSPCFSASACQQVTITVNSKSTAPTSGTANPAIICVGSSSALSISGGILAPGAIIKWYTGFCGNTYIGSGNGFMVTPTTTTTYYGRYEDVAPCNSSTACVAVTVNVSVPPTVNAGAAMAVCGDANQATPANSTSFNITSGSSASNYSSVLWASSGTGTFSNANSLTLASYAPSAADKTAGSVTLTLTAYGNANCSSVTSSKILTIGKTIVNVVKLNSICNVSGQTIVSITQGSPAVSGGDGQYAYQWYFSTPGNSSFNLIPGETNSTLSVAQVNINGFYSRLIISGGCSSFSNSIHINTNNILQANLFNVTGGGSYCGSTGAGVPVGVSGSVDGLPDYIVTYQLYRNGVYTGVFAVGTGLAISFPNQTIAGTYTVKAVISVVNGISCSALSITGSVTVAVDAAPPAAVAGSNQSLCNVYTTTLTGSNPYPYAGAWTLISGSGTISNPTSASTAVTGLTLGDNVFQWKIKNNTCADSSRVTIRIEPPLSITSHPVETVFCAGNSASMTVSASGNNIHYQWMESTDNGISYHNLTDNSLYSGTATDRLAFSTIPLTMSGYLYKATVWTNAPCGTTLETNATHLYVRNLWTGVADNNWFNPLNWSGGNLPDNTCPDVRIPARVNQPTLSNGIGSARDIYLSAGAILTIDNGTLQVSGTIDNTGTIIASNGTVEFNGVTNQAIPVNTFQNNDLKNLVIGNTGNLTLNGSLNLSGKLAFNGTGKTLITNDQLTLKSTANGTAYVAEIPEDAAGVAQDSITGKVTVERFIPAQKAWYLLSIPTNGTQTIHESWQENQAPNSTGLSGYGIQITSNLTNWSALGFDLGTPTGASMKIYNSSTNGFDPVASAFNPIKTTKGYMTLIRGDRTVNAFGQAPTTTVLRTKGTLYTGKQPALTTNANEFAVVGNQFASSIDFGKISRTGGIQDIFYLWDPKLAGSNGLGAYQTFIRQGSNYVAIPGGGSYVSGNSAIGSGQAFMVHATGTAGTITIAESSKSDSSKQVKREGNNFTQLQVNISVVSGGSPYLIDGAISEFDSAYSDTVDELDALKISNLAESISIIGAGKNLAAERRSDIRSTDTIFYDIAKLQQKEYELAIMPQGFSNTGLAAFLEDNFLATSSPVSFSGTEMKRFTVTSDPLSKASNRFRIVFKQVNILPVKFISITAKRASTKNVSVNWTVAQESNTRAYEVERSTDGNNFSKIGTVAASAVSGTQTYVFEDQQATASVLYYRIRNLGNDGSKAFSSVAKVAGISTTGEIKVFPNPVADKTVHIRFTKQAAGNYQLRLISSAGQTVDQRAVNVSNEYEFIQFKNAGLLPGIYTLLIVSPEKQQTALTVFVQ